MFCFSGFSGSGKTTLISKLIPELKEFKIGYIKHDAHGFEMDQPGKDTFIMKKAGAEIVMINDQESEAILADRVCFHQEKNIFLDSDMVIVEGHKYSKLPKIILVDDELNVLREIDAGKIELPLAFIGTAEKAEFCKKYDRAFFSRDDIAAITQFIRQLTSEKLKAIPLFGLVLTGGMSTRMKRDKGGIDYHGISQAEYTYNLLTKYCSDVYISCRSEQGENEYLKNLPQIHDRFLGFGPLGGILSAMSTHRHAAWLVMACDLPMVDIKFLKTLVENRAHQKMATSFYHSSEKRYEPLAAIYEPKSFHRMFYFLAEGKTCPQKVLYNSAIKTIQFDFGDEIAKCLENANTAEDYLELQRLITSAKEAL